MTAPDQTATSLLGKEQCPGHLTWSAFGASYPDSACSSALDWSDCDYTPVAELCDADDDYRPKGVPCPFCDPKGFTEYEFAEATALWASDESPVLAGTEIHYHDGRSLTWTATHPERGEETVLMRQMEEES